jgi:hypothetical protein
MTRGLRGVSACRPCDVPCKEHGRGKTKLYPTSEHLRGDR